MTDDFLSRWSRRKIQARTGAVLPPDADTVSPQPEDIAAPPADVPPDAHAATLAPEPAETEPELSPEEVAALPPVEALHAGSDFTQFLRRGVPAALKSAALRRLWVSDPGIRDFIGEARDYAWDWNVAGGVPGSGPLAPGTDVEGMVRRIFGDREDDEAHAEVADAQASEPVETETADPSPAAGAEDVEAPPESPKPDAIPAEHQIVSSDDAPLAAKTPHLASLRKHGSATPIS